MIEKVNTPQDLKKLSIPELNILADEIRNILIKRVSYTSGHMGSNLGIIEMTIALHYVFDSPQDKFIFDVSHQTYTHKILTNRKDAFLNQEKYFSISGYTTPLESEHDIFKVGHTSTSISLACGLAKARDLKNTHENIIAIIGDGSLSGGEAFEGLNNISLLSSNFILIVNDNEMSIAENQGGMYQNFKKLRETNGKYENNFFTTFGLKYEYLEEGNNLEKLIELFKKVKDCSSPIVLHIHTLKGKGLPWAQENKEDGHWVQATSTLSKNTESYDKITANFLLKEMKINPQLIAISAATPKAVGFNKEVRELAKHQFIDVGICEEHAIAFASGLAKNGATPVLLISSSFLQRTYDQLNQDLAMNQNPATILVFNGKINGGDCTHVGQYDIVLTSNIPNLVCVAPTTKQEYLAILNYSLHQKKYPMVIRVPKEVMHQNEFIFNEQQLFHYQIQELGQKIAILGLGNFFFLGKEVSALLKNLGFHPTLINPFIYSHLDKETLDKLKKNHEIVITLEDGCVEGGWCYKIANYYASTRMKVLTFGGEKNFNDLLSLNEIYAKCHLFASTIVEDILAILKE